MGGVAEEMQEHQVDGVEPQPLQTLGQRAQHPGSTEIEQRRSAHLGVGDPTDLGRDDELASRHARQKFAEQGLAGAATVERCSVEVARGGGS